MADHNLSNPPANDNQLTAGYNEFCAARSLMYGAWCEWLANRPDSAGVEEELAATESVLRQLATLESQDG